MKHITIFIIGILVASSSLLLAMYDASPLTALGAIVVGGGLMIGAWFAYSEKVFAELQVPTSQRLQEVTAQLDYMVAQHPPTTQPVMSAVLNLSKQMAKVCVAMEKSY